MTKEWILKYIIYNGEINSVKETEILNITKKICIYEVIRIIDGIPLYVEEHLTRLRKSAELLNIRIDKTDEEFIDEIMKLVKINNGYNSNIKILCCSDEGKRIKDIYLYFIKSFYPTKLMYEEGIDTILCETERENPNAKYSNHQLREKINSKLKERDAFEAILVNNNMQITEGSRSNIFFVKDKRIITSLPNKVLLGITRAKILELCRAHNIEVIEGEISLGSIKEYEGAFITGTSISVLPVKSIDKIKINSSRNDIIIKVMKIYEEDKNNYILKKN